MQNGDGDHSSYTLSSTEVFNHYSSCVGQEYRIVVAFPRGYEEASTTYPALYALDAAAGFGTLIEGQRLMSMRDEVENILIVGIDYPTHDFVETLPLRSRDLTPTDYPDFSKKYPENAALATDGIGGGPRFFQYLSEELLPLIGSRYPVDASDQGILGVSLGGLFAVYCLLAHPNTFKRYAICSPSLWWNDGVMFRLEEEYAKNHSRLSASVFCCVGELEHKEMVDNMQTLARKLSERGYEDFELRSAILQGETHLSMTGAAIWRALRELYEPKQQTRTKGSG